MKSPGMTWSAFISGSIPWPGSIPDYGAHFTESVMSNVNNEHQNIKSLYITRIDDILSLALRFDPNGDSIESIREIRDRYLDTGVLTKQDMTILNTLFKILEFDKKYNPDKETTISKISRLLKGLTDG